MGRSIESFSEEVHDTAIDKGWWPEKENEEALFKQVPEKLLLIVSEISEATEEYRSTKTLADLRRVIYAEKTLNGFMYHESQEYRGCEPIYKPEGFAVEVVDAVIRAFDLLEAIGIDVEKVLEIKHAYNRTRPARHGGKTI